MSIRLLFVVAAVLGSAGTAAQVPPASGRVLYETHCGGCHYARIHERDVSRSKIQSLAELRDMVARWAPQTGRRFTYDEIESVAQYLNDRYYRKPK